MKVNYPELLQPYVFIHLLFSDFSDMPMHGEASNEWYWQLSSQWRRMPGWEQGGIESEGLINDARLS